MSRKVSEATIKQLFARSWNVCAFENCNNELVKENKVIWEICHIEWYSPKGPRYNKSSNDTERNSPDNLIIMCSNCHTLIDNDISTYSVEYLKDLKNKHEKLNESKRYSLPDEVLGQIYDKLEEFFALYHKTWTNTSKEYTTIIWFISLLSENDELDDNSIEKEPDPEKKIMKRFSDYSEELINELIELKVIYGTIMEQAEISIGLNKKSYKLMTMKLKRDSINALTKNNWNPLNALDDLTYLIEQQLQRKWIEEYEEWAIRYCLLYRLVKCFIFPNNDI